MYAVGLIPLLIFSCRVLGHYLRKRDIFGAILLAVGAGMLGLGEWLGEATPMSMVGHRPILICAALWLVAAPLIGFWSQRQKRLKVGLILGALGGGFLSLDALLKGLAQADGTASAFLPETSYGILLFVASFVGAIAAFLMTQWAHRREAPPAETLAGYDAAYVALPVLLVPAAAGQSGVNPVCLLGLAVIGVGLFLLTRKSSIRF